MIDMCSADQLMAKPSVVKLPQARVFERLHTSRQSSRQIDCINDIVQKP